MKYIVDERKEITHVLVPIDEWISMREKQGEDSSINPYQPAIEWIESTLKANSPTGEIPSLVGLSTRIEGQDLYSNMPVYNMLKTILEQNLLMGSEEVAAMNKSGGLRDLLSLMYPSVPITDAKAVAVMYILRNNEFYTALRNTEEGIPSSDVTVLSHYGFDIEKFKREAEPKLLNILYSGDKSEFVFTAMSTDIGSFFKLSPIKERIRREPGQLRFFFYDLFDALDEILLKAPSLNDVFKQHPLVDKLAKAVYPSNTLSGSTSRVYKAAKEARTIIAGDWQDYVDVN